MRRPLMLLLALVGVALLVPTAAHAGGLDSPMPIYIGGWGFDHPTIMTLAAVALLIFLLCYWWSRGLNKDNPSRGQVLLEMIVTTFDDLVKDAMGKNRARGYLPYIGTLFLFIWFSNMAGILPLPNFFIGGDRYMDYNNSGFYEPGEPVIEADGDLNYEKPAEPGFWIPAPSEPTKNVNVPLALALLFVLVIGHGSSIYYNGIGGYIADYFSPGGLIGVILFPLNVVGKIAELVSISFRLFGNIFGGAVIIFVVSGLVQYLVLPIFLYGFFGVFVGTIQAFVFTMLALTYIAAGAAETEDA